MEKLTRIVFTGPESCGKTSLTEMLSSKLGLPYVTEFARTYLNEILEKGQKYDLNDVLFIGKMQLKTEQKIRSKNDLPVVCDTDLTVICIWLKFVFNKQEIPFEKEILKLIPNSYYFLCYPDIAWEPDPQREHPKHRLELFELYEELLIKLGAKYTVVYGDMDERLSFCLKLIDSFKI
jgi:nicotinamide riboside kinase